MNRKEFEVLRKQAALSALESLSAEEAAAIRELATELAEKIPHVGFENALALVAAIGQVMRKRSGWVSSMDEIMKQVQSLQKAQN
jgi:aspartokinase